MVSYGENTRKATLQELADGLCADEEIQYVLLESQKTASLDAIEVGEAKSIFTKLKKYPYEFEIDENLQLASVDGVKVATTNPSNEEVKETMADIQKNMDEMKQEIRELKEENQSLKSDMNTKITNLETSLNTNWTLTELATTNSNVDTEITLSSSLEDFRYVTVGITGGNGIVKILGGYVSVEQFKEEINQIGVSFADTSVRATYVSDTVCKLITNTLGREAILYGVK